MVSVRILTLGLVCLAAGCAYPPVGWDSPDPAARLEMIRVAGRDNDRAAIPRLIESLQHDDPVVRMWAIRTLEQMTGQTLGYDYAAPEWERRDRVEAWAQWYRSGQRGGSDNMPGQAAGGRG